MLDTVRERLTFVDTMRAIESVARRHPGFSGIYIEDKANDSAVIDVLSCKSQACLHTRCAKVSGIFDFLQNFLVIFAGFTQKILMRRYGAL